MNRQEYNFKIAGIISKTSVNDIVVNKNTLSNTFRELAILFPQQRAGQIFSNYILPEITQEDIVRVIKELFPINYDLFFEESSETFKRLNNEKQK